MIHGDFMDELDPFQILNLQANHIKEELDAMLTSKEITEDTYNKNITMLAYEFAVNRLCR